MRNSKSKRSAGEGYRLCGSQSPIKCRLYGKTGAGIVDWRGPGKGPRDLGRKNRGVRAVKEKEPVMRELTTYVSLDAHKKEHRVAMRLPGWTSESRIRLAGVVYRASSSRERIPKSDGSPPWAKTRSGGFGPVGKRSLGRANSVPPSSAKQRASCWNNLLARRRQMSRVCLLGFLHLRVL